ncbi:MAG: DNA-processing protein DprA [Elusimicrobiota bacterium]
MEIKEKLYFLKLNSVFVYSNTDWVINFVEKYGKVSILFENSAVDLISEAELLVEKFKKIIDNAKKFDAEKEIEDCEKRKIDIITYMDDNYPASLKNISNPPLVLYVKGKIEDKLSLSVVGTRKPTEYGAKYASKICFDIAKTGIVITSGLARGIDTIAHKTAIKAGGTTWAVIGSGFNRIYPPENKELAEDIIKNGGAIISEYPLSSQPLKMNFPRRNRIISALSFATFVVEGDYNSGALITARYAIEQGKDVMALPGSIDNRYSNGPNKLIKEGAYLVRNALDIIELIPTSELFGVDIKKLYVKEVKKLDLTPLASKIYKIIEEKSEVTPDEISHLLGIKISELFTYLFELEASGLVTLFGGKYSIRKF